MDKKYYWISYVYKNTRNNDVGFENTVTTTHPFKDKLFKKSDGYGYYKILKKYWKKNMKCLKNNNQIRILTKLLTCYT
ncbi:hypothetical protein GCM10008908_24130 [Clostridium subterminale]|uniref:Uncharacterized protein n=1 Tax=Clostridium subterminale TaxID=1550 RepID=A0ABP3W0U1_CLOSU